MSARPAAVRRASSAPASTPEGKGQRPTCRLISSTSSSTSSTSTSSSTSGTGTSTSGTPTATGTATSTDDGGDATGPVVETDRPGGPMDTGVVGSGLGLALLAGIALAIAGARRTASRRH